jgi:hypothetical protein
MRRVARRFLIAWAFLVMLNLAFHALEVLLGRSYFSSILSWAIRISSYVAALLLYGILLRRQSRTIAANGWDVPG